jgi:hypothetical protein
LVELGAHVAQTHSVVRAADWAAAREYVATQARPEDLVAFAPRWADPLGREHFGADIATVEREARGDESRFPRAFEVSIRGARLPAFATWRDAGDRRFGRVTVTTWENPAPARVVEDLVAMVDPDRMRVARVAADGREADCAFVRSAPLSGQLGFGPAVPGNRFACSGGAFVGASVVADLDYAPRRCVYTTAAGGGLMRLRFLGVQFAQTLHGHHGLYVEAERSRSGAPIAATFKVGDAVLGSVVHRDGDGWKPFEFATVDLAGRRADLVVEIASVGDRRMYCLEADTR